MFPPSFLCLNQGIVLRDTNPDPACLRLQGSHPLWQAVPGHFNFTGEGAVGPYNTTFLHSFLHRFGLDSSPFARRYLRESRLISLPPPTWMFPFGGFPPLLGVLQVLPVAGGPIRESPDRRPRAPTRSLSQLATPFISAQAKPSIKWRIMPSLLRNPHIELASKAYAWSSP